MDYITHMQLDFNLLAALHALLEEGSVAGAAARMHLSQPAMSRTLGRIRQATGDEILVRTGRTMTATPRALAIREEVRQLVHRSQAVLSPEPALDLLALERTFTLRCHDAIATAIGAGLLAKIRSHAPRAQVRLLSEASTDTNELRYGHVDLEVGASAPELPEIRFETIGHDRLVMVARANHRCMRGRLSIEKYAAAQHLVVSRRGRVRDALDDALAAHGLKRHVLAAVATSAAALYCAARADVVVAVAERMCGGMIEALGLRTRPLPVALDPIPIVMAWHQRYQGDHGHAWLRDQIRALIIQCPSRAARRARGRRSALTS
jgi:DNA-binding transcriptional LysR family regulator